MPAAKLPKKLHARLDFLAGRVRQVRLLRAVARAAFVLPVAALVGILADAYLGLPEAVRIGLFAGWVALLLREIWNTVRARTAAVDLEAVASAVEQEFPRLAERLTTAVELAEHADEANGSPALIDEVIQDADSRARKLDLAAAFPTGPAVTAFVTAGILFGLLLIPAFFAPHGGEHMRRFFLPWYTPAKTVPYKVVITSGDPAVKRGDPVTLTAYVEATKPDAELPTTATLIVTANGQGERLVMTAQEGNVWHARRPAAEADFDYRVEAGAAVSETHHVAVVEPITLAAARVTVTPPAYAAGRDLDPPVEGLGELTSLAHGSVTFELKFAPRPATAVLQFTPTVGPDAKAEKQFFPLRVAADGAATLVVPAKVSGTFALSAEGDRGVRTEFPSQLLLVRKDDAPKLPRVEGVGDRAREVRPTEKIVVGATAIDDVAVAKLVLEWKIDDGLVQVLPLTVPGLPAPQADGKVVLNLTDRVKVGQKVTCRLAATDNRDVPEAGLTPQTTYFPAMGWAEFTVDARADPLAEQDIRGRQAEIDTKLKAIQKELTAESADTDRLRKTAAAARPVDPDEVKELRHQLAETAGKMNDLARDAGVTPEFARLSQALRGLADRELRDADAALGKVKDQPRSDDRAEQLRRAKDALDAALRKVDELKKANDRIAQERLDRRKLEDLAQEQKDLAEKAKTADPQAAAELARKQKELADELKKLQEQSAAIQNAVASAKAEDAKALEAEAKRLADAMRALSDAMNRSEKSSAQQHLADLKKQQDELAKRAKELADRTDTASRVAEVPPLNPDPAQKAKEALDRGDLDEAARQQERARQELERLARDLEQAAANGKDPRAMAKQLARLQEDLRNRLAEETKDKPLDQLPAERRAALEKQQEAIERAAARLRTPVGDPTALTARERAVGDAQQARENLKKGADKAADKKMQETRESLARLAETLPTREQRLAQARDEVARLQKQQEAIRQQAEAAAEAVQKNNPDAAAAQRDLARKLADTAKQQAALADQLSKLDTPGQEARKNKAADALQRAGADLTAGRPQDAAASQQQAKRELDRLAQALNGETPADEKAAELAKKQRELAQEAAANANKPDRAKYQELQKRQAEIARETEQLRTPEAASAQYEASQATRRAAESPKAADLAKRAGEAADKLDQLNEQVNGRESAAAAADRLAQKQRANAEAQAKRQDNAGTGEARRKAAQELEELKNLRPGPDAQQAKQQAQDALQRAANTFDPQANTKAQREAAQALGDLAEKLERNEAAQGGPKTEEPADAADRLAKKQKELAEQTKRAGEQSKQQPGEAGQQAARQAAADLARAQRDLAKQAGQMPGRDSPKDQQQAQEAMGKAVDELARENFAGAVQKQQEAADALERLSRQNQQQQAAGEAPGMPSKEQAEAARTMAEEQRRLQAEAMKAGEELAKETSPGADNPVGGLAKEQEQIAREAGDLARKVAERQGAKAEPAKDARQAADAAEQASGQVKNGDLNRAKEAGQKAAQAMEKLAGDPAGGDAGQKAQDLARRQSDVNQKLQQLAKDAGAGRAQQAARQQQLEQQARGLQRKLDDLAGKAGDPMGPPAEQAKDAARSAGRAGDQMAQARDAGRKGQGEQAGQARDRAAEAMDRAAQQAGAAAKQLAGEKGSGSPQAGQALDQAKDQMGRAGEKLGQGQPGPAGEAMQKAADSLREAANQLAHGNGPGQGNNPGPGKGRDGQTSGGNPGGPGGTLDLRNLSPEVAKYTGKSWGELPGQVKQQVIQEFQAKYGADYARNIKLYFEQLAERK